VHKPHKKVRFGITDVSILAFTPTFRKGLRGDNPTLTGFGQMAKTATRGRRRKSSAKSKGRAGGNALPWAIVGIMAVGAIATYDNWKSVKPMLATHAPAVLGETAAARPAASKDQMPKSTAPQQVALASPLTRPLPPASIPTQTVPAAEPAKAVPVSISPAASQTGTAAFGYCGQGEHINCVVDGGSFWYKGEKIIIADIVSPGLDAARCDGERKIAFAAKSRLLKLLNAGAFNMNAAGKASSAGAPRVVSRDGHSIGMQLINEGLARKPGNNGSAWCA
jgi:endonuclease YncB( thermonuclease family)